jgi:hypothetical protein
MYVRNLYCEGQLSSEYRGKDIVTITRKILKDLKGKGYESTLYKREAGTRVIRFQPKKDLENMATYEMNVDMQEMNYD